MSKKIKVLVRDKNTLVLDEVANVGDIIDLTELKEFFHYDERSMSVIGEKTKTKYSMGDMVLVKVTRASKEEQIIDFEIIKKIEEDNKENELI